MKLKISGRRRRDQGYLQVGSLGGIDCGTPADGEEVGEILRARERDGFLRMSVSLQCDTHLPRGVGRLDGYAISKFPNHVGYLQTRSKIS